MTTHYADVLKERQRKAKAARRQIIINGCSAIAGRFLGGGLFYLIGWNFGATEIIERLGGPDANINFGIALAAFVLVECVKSRAPGEASA